MKLPKKATRPKAGTTWIAGWSARHHIYKKHMVDISPRVQRLIVRSFPYQPFNVIYKKGKDIPVADALS